ncbi:Hsp70 family protein [Candidatus Berkiella cookevillensis]|uniref:Chaperone protein DnaK n=1 Tax=Candidatus Berkiella cookevillensis TaxID=437022 RepID=A0A0Q9YC80_9GAMM|nr:Hsp70 family protein [Candidatus Berkiella cookevillensis]MCS5708654.1 Hsp70 family protein [Candidatus Berkiella cookevillensis]
MLSCGLDFGTSNSTLAISHHSKTSLIALNGESPILKSAIFFDSEIKEHFIGQCGIDRYLEGGKGRLMLSLKSILGSALLNEKIAVCGEWITYRDIIGLVIKYIKETAERQLNTELSQVVLGRPVRYHDTNDARDKLAQDTMELIMKEQGFKEVVFQFEPIAAALDYESSIRNEQLALIIDLGGGTSDFTIIRLNNKTKTINRKADILANGGIHIGGTNFDKDLSLHAIMPLLGKGSIVRGMNGSKLEMPTSLYYDLTSWHLLNNLYSTKTINEIKDLYLVSEQKFLIKRAITVLEKKLGHYLLQAAENSKIKLSSSLLDDIDISKVEDDLQIAISRDNFESYCHNLINGLQRTIETTLSAASIHADQIDSVFLTGGTTQIPVVHRMICNLFPNAQFVTGDVYGSVGKGLAIIAEELWR